MPTSGIFFEVQQQGHREKLRNEPRFITLTQMKPGHFCTVTRRSCPQRTATLFLFDQYVVVRQVLEAYRLIDDEARPSPCAPTCKSKTRPFINTRTAMTVPQSFRGPRPPSAPATATAAAIAAAAEGVRRGSASADQLPIREFNFPAGQPLSTLPAPTGGGPPPKGGTRPGHPAGG